MSSGAPTIGPSVTVSSPAASSWGSKSANSESPPSSAVQESINGFAAFGAYPYGRVSPPRSREGWPLIAELMAEAPPFEAFGRFRSLNIKNLLYYHVELTKLERELNKIEMEDMDPLNDEPETGYKWSQICERPEIMIPVSTNALPHPQWAKVKEIRQTIREYNEALLQYAQVSALGEPSTHNMRELVTWIHDRNLGKLKVTGDAAKKWGPYSTRPRDVSLSRFLSLFMKFIKPSPKSPHVSDLIAPRAGQPPDRLSRWISEEFLPFRWDFGEYWSKKREKKADEEKNDGNGKAEETNEKQPETVTHKACDERIGKQHVQICQQTTILSFTAGICTLLACMLPIGAIFLLAILNELWHRLYMIASFALAFAACLMVFTEATRVQVFTATSAFLAVLVVFIPNN